MSTRRKKHKGLICSPWKPEWCPGEAGLGCLLCSSMYNGWDFQEVGVQVPKTDAHSTVSHFWKAFGRIPNYMEPIHSYTAHKWDATDLMVCSQADIWFVFVELLSLLMASWSRMGLNEKGKVIHRKMAQLTKIHLLYSVSLAVTVSSNYRQLGKIFSFLSFYLSPHNNMSVCPSSQWLMKAWKHFRSNRVRREDEE